MKIIKMIRDTCYDLKIYLAGKSTADIKREFGLKSIVKLNSNENSLCASKKTIKEIKKNIKNIFLYPDSNAYKLKRSLAKKYQLSIDNIFIGAGGDEIIELIAKLFFNQEDEIIVSKHSFTRYSIVVKLMGAKLIVVPTDNNLKQNLIAITKVCNKNTKAIFIANPNNPTGTYNTKKEFSIFLEKMAINKFNSKPIIVLDESYFEYALSEKNYPNGLDYLKENKNLIVFRTFSKIYGLAGLRVAYGFASREIVNYIERVRPPFSVNILAQVAAITSINDKKHVLKSQKLVMKEKQYFYIEFNKSNIKYIQSAANFIIFNTLPLSGKEMFIFLLKKGIITRSLYEYDLENWIRVTIGSHKENKLFIKKINEIFKEYNKNT